MATNAALDRLFDYLDILQFNMMKRFLVFIFLGILSAFPLSAQDETSALAYEYYSKGEYNKAVELYKEIVKDEKMLVKVHRFYLESMLKLDQQKEADKYLKRLVRRYPDVPIFNIDYGISLIEPHDSTKAFEYFNEFIDRISKNQVMLQMAATHFSDAEFYPYAEKSYFKAQKMFPQESYEQELADLYETWGKKEEMIEQYLKMLETDPMQMHRVQAALQDRLPDADDFQLLEPKLVKYIQNDPNNLTFGEMMLWYLLQQKKYYRAFMQARAIDKRKKMDGFKVLEIGKMALNNGAYPDAIRIFEYLVKEYAGKPVYAIARNSLIKSKEEQVKNTYPVDMGKIESLVDDYQQLITDLGIRSATAEAIQNMALLEAFYLNNRDTAIVMLESLVKLRGLPHRTISEAKLHLGDIYLLKDEPWEASLLYSQVEKTELDSDLGHQAKLRNAKVTYYAGDFELAKAHLDILKLATSREISNDAMDLSLLIGDNLNLDTTEVTMQKYAAIDLLKFQGKYDEALAAYDQLLAEIEGHTLTDEIYWDKANILLKIGRFEESVANLEKILEGFGEDILADDANFMIGKIYEEYLNDTDKAMEYYRKQLTAFPGSTYVKEARQRFRILRGDKI